MRSNGGFADRRPINAGAQLFAAKFTVSDPLNGWAVFSRDTSVTNPLLNGLIPANAKSLCCSYWASKSLDGSCDEVFGFHVQHFRQEKLAKQDAEPEILAMTNAPCHPKFRAMNEESIHQRIKRLRESAKLSMEELAERCGLKSWQAVQQWENGKTAPKRLRL